MNSIFEPKQPEETVLEAPPAPTVMPDPDDKAKKATSRRKFQRMRAGHGRMSTQNTGGTNFG